MANKVQKDVTQQPEATGDGKLNVQHSCPYCERWDWHEHAIATGDTPALIFCKNCERWYVVRVYLSATAFCAPIKGE